jgi:hypothetical protein
MLQSVAREIDRLVWAVGDEARLRHQRHQMPASDALEPALFGPVFNLVPFIDDLTESFVRRRYIYRPTGTIDSFVAAVVDRGYFHRDGDVLTPSPELGPITLEIGATTRTISRELWGEHLTTAQSSSASARAVLERSPIRDGLARAAVEAAEPDDEFHRLHQRLAGLRLLRNEAHVDAWRPMGLQPADVEALTSAWAGSMLQAPLVMSPRLEALGFAHDGEVTSDGLAARQRIEEQTDAGVANAFSAVDVAAFLDELTSLPGSPQR